MAKHGKKYTAAAAKVDRLKNYSVEEAVALAKRAMNLKSLNPDVSANVNKVVEYEIADSLTQGSPNKESGAVTSTSPPTKRDRDINRSFIGMQTKPVNDNRVIRLIGMTLRSGVMTEEGGIEPTQEGSDV